MTPNGWRLFQGSGQPHAVTLPEPPPWRVFPGVVHREPDRGAANAERGQTFQSGEALIDLVNTALYLRRPILLTGKPGTGKSSLAYALAHELQLGRVLTWPITTRTTLADGLYRYDAIARLQQQQLNHYDALVRLQQQHLNPAAVETHPQELAGRQDIGQFLRLGPLGTALLPSTQPRVLLIDEIDKSDIDLPNDLLHIFEEGRFEIPELSRLAAIHPTPEIRPMDSDISVPVPGGIVQCLEFPVVILTSNGEREFPPAFKRRCLRMTIQEPEKDELQRIVAAHFTHIPEERRSQITEVIDSFFNHKSRGQLATDQLLNAVHLVLGGVALDSEQLAATVWKHLSTGDAERL